MTPPTTTRVTTRVLDLLQALADEKRLGIPYDLGRATAAIRDSELSDAFADFLVNGGSGGAG